MMGQVSKERSTTIKEEGCNAIQATIYRKEDPPGMGLEKVQRGRYREIERESDHCITENYVSKEPSILS